MLYVRLTPIDGEAHAIDTTGLSRDTSYLLAMYLRDPRSLDYLRSRPDWDGRTLVLMGTSDGRQVAARRGVNASDGA